MNSTYPITEPLYDPEDTGGANLVVNPTSGTAAQVAAPAPEVSGVPDNSPINTAQIQAEMNAFKIAQLLQENNERIATLERERSAATGKAPVKLDADADELPAEYANDPHMQRIFALEKLTRSAVDSMNSMAQAQQAQQEAGAKAAREAHVAQVRNVESSNVLNWFNKVLVPDDVVLSKNPAVAALVEVKVQDWLRDRFDPSQNQAGIRQQYGMLQMELDAYLRQKVYPVFSAPSTREVVNVAQAAAQNNLSTGGSGVAPKPNVQGGARHAGNAKDFSDRMKAAAERLGVKVG